MTLASFTEFLPADVLHLLQTRVTAEFATISAKGIPIDTPTFFFPDPRVATLDIGTGVAYPAKAERARRNPKVGMLIEGDADQPVVLVAGMAAVQDADIQANLNRYLAETIFSPNVDPAIVPWENTRKRLYYLSRIIVAVAPVHVRWWPDRASLDEPPSEWRAPEGTVFPRSDPAPSGTASLAPQWRQPDWQELAGQAMDGGMPAHLTLLDADGFPTPMRARKVERIPAGFRIHLPAATPGTSGAASLSFVGKEIFVGEADRQGDTVILQVERCLPVLPMMDDRKGMDREVLAQLQVRLETEMQRRNQPVPSVPASPPEPTQGALFRAAATRAMDNGTVGGGISR
jgi:hypothetical protein